MKYRNKLIGILVAGLMVSGLAIGQQTLDGVIAVVGDYIILKSELLQQSQMVASQNRIEIGSEGYKAIQKNVLNELVNQKVLLMKAVEDTITIDDQQVERELSNRIDVAIKQYGSIEKVEEFFGSPINKIKRNYREEMRNTLIVNQVRSSKTRMVTITRTEVEAFFETMKDSLPQNDAMIKLRHILMEIKPGGAAYARGMERIREVQSRIAAGESFESLTAEFSEDPGTSENGGDLGWLERGNFDEIFEEAAFIMEPGQISDVIQSSIGLHLIKVDEKEAARIHVRHIFIRLTTSADDDDATLQKMISVRRRLDQGVSFDSLALVHSEDPTTNLQGGDLGWLPVKQLQIESFRLVADTLAVGQISAPFKTQFGYHIVFKEDAKEARDVNIDEDYEDLKSYALRYKQRRIMTDWIAELKKKIFIDMKENML
ncbi:peptidylprolyl isomerase [bacterium]|nr:peptidylprolyl isomerase [bacterium]